MGIIKIIFTLISQKPTFVCFDLLFQELLTDSSDDRSEYWNVSTRNSRKCRGRRNRVCPGFLKACNAFLACASVLATASLIWLFIDVRQQLTALRTELDQGTGLISPDDWRNVQASRVN